MWTRIPKIHYHLPLVIKLKSLEVTGAPCLINKITPKFVETIACPKKSIYYIIYGISLRM
jgi:hypothetical protein